MSAMSSITRDRITAAHALIVEAMTVRGKKHKLVEGDELDSVYIPTSEKSAVVPFRKTDAAEQKIYAVVFEPDTPDADGHTISAADIEKAAHRFLAVCKSHESFDTKHNRQPRAVIPIESYVAPAEFWMGEELVRKGSWVVGLHVLDTDVWARIESGEFTGISIEAMAHILEEE